MSRLHDKLDEVVFTIVEKDEFIGSIVDTGLDASDNKAYEILGSVIGQLSDGIWENSKKAERYWKNLDIDKRGGKIVILAHGYYSSPFYDWRNDGMVPDEKIKAYMATKIKQIVKEEGLEWSRENTQPSAYMAYNDSITVRDCYRVYDKLLGRKDRITEATDNAEWKDICRKFCSKIGAELLFVNDDNFGYESKDGELVHMYADELAEYLKTHDLKESEENNLIATIYQIPGRDDADYIFMPYDYAKDKFDFNDYLKVATISIPPIEDINETLEYIFMVGNTRKDTFTEIQPMRSISVSDVIKINDDIYYVDAFGFQKVGNLNEGYSLGDDKESFDVWDEQEKKLEEICKWLEEYSNVDFSNIEVEHSQDSIYTADFTIKNIPEDSIDKNFEFELYNKYEDYGSPINNIQLEKWNGPICIIGFDIDSVYGQKSSFGRTVNNIIEEVKNHKKDNNVNESFKLQDPRDRRKYVIVPDKLDDFLKSSEWQNILKIIKKHGGEKEYPLPNVDNNSYYPYYYFHFGRTDDLDERRIATLKDLNIPLEDARVDGFHYYDGENKELNDFETVIHINGIPLEIKTGLLGIFITFLCKLRELGPDEWNPDKEKYQVRNGADDIEKKEVAYEIAKRDYANNNTPENYKKMLDAKNALIAANDKLYTNS